MSYVNGDGKDKHNDEEVRHRKIAGIAFDNRFSLGNVLTFLGLLVAVVVYVVDLRSSVMDNTKTNVEINRKIDKINRLRWTKAHMLLYHFRCKQPTGCPDPSTIKIPGYDDRGGANTR